MSHPNAVVRFADSPLVLAEAIHSIRLKGVDRLEALMVEQLPLIEIAVVHHFTPGQYAREVTIPAGTLLTGKIHRTRHRNIVSKGRIAVWTEAEGVREITAPFEFVAEPGTRRVGYAIEETVWTTIHDTDETDLEKLEAELIEAHTNPLLPAKEVPCLGSA